jgi:16S rRNA (guanine527-N7)-methyltransferase
MLLAETTAYEAYGLSPAALDLLSRFGDLLLASKVNVTSLRAPEQIERGHFLDSLSLLLVPEVRSARSIVDVGSGGGLPAVVLAIALPECRLVALESVGKKCEFIRRAADDLGLLNLDVCWARAEEYGAAPVGSPTRLRRAAPPRVSGSSGGSGGAPGRALDDGPGFPCAAGAGRESFDVAVARAVAALPVLAELCLPLIRPGGAFVAMKGVISNQECMEGETAAAILGAKGLLVQDVQPLPGADRRCLAIFHKRGVTPAAYPRRAGLPGKKPLGRPDGLEGKSAER